MTNDTKTTILGGILAGLTATTIDYPKLTQGDLGEIVKTSIVVIIAVFGHFTNKKERN